jgi:hypothetical protein
MGWEGFECAFGHAVRMPEPARRFQAMGARGVPSRVVPLPHSADRLPV